MKFITVFAVITALLTSSYLFAQHHHSPGHQSASSQLVTITNPQPLIAQAGILKQALSYLGSPLSSTDEKALEALQKQAHTTETANKIQQILDPYCIAFID